MGEIILFGFLTLIFGLLIGLRVLLFIRKKVQGKEINFPKEMLFILLLFFAMVGSGIYTVVKIGKEAAEKAPKVVEAGKTAISNTVAFGTEAVFEGFGKSIDHFDQKWEKAYQKKLENISIETSAIKRFSIGNNKDSIVLAGIMHNKNPEDERIDLVSLLEYNYLLVKGSNELFYPVKILSKVSIQFIPSGKTEFTFHTAMPDTIKPIAFRLSDQKIDIQFP